MLIRTYEVITPNPGDYIGNYIDTVVEYLHQPGNRDKSVLVIWGNKHYFANTYTTKNSIINYFLNV